MRKRSLNVNYKRATERGVYERPVAEPKGQRHPGLGASRSPLGFAIGEDQRGRDGEGSRSKPPRPHPPRPPTPSRPWHKKGGKCAGAQSTPSCSMCSCVPAPHEVCLPGTCDPAPDVRRCPPRKRPATKSFSRRSNRRAGWRPRGWPERRSRGLQLAEGWHRSEYVQQVHRQSPEKARPAHTSQTHARARSW